MTGVEHASWQMMVFIAVVFALVIINIRKAHRGIDIYVRRIAGIDAIDEALGRAAELGRPVSFSTGLTGVGPVLYACLGVLHYVTTKVARYSSRLFVPQNDPAALAIVEDTVREGFRDAGKLSAFDPQCIVFLSEEQFAFASGYMGLLHREKVGSAFIMGSFAGESLILAEAGQQIGAMQVAASVSPEQVAFFIAACDYTLIGEELFGAAAYLSREPVQLGSLVAQDRSKAIVAIIIVIGVLYATVMQFMGAPA